MHLRNFLKESKEKKEEKSAPSTDALIHAFQIELYGKSGLEPIYYNIETDSSITEFRKLPDLDAKSNPTKLKLLKDQYAILVNEFKRWCDANELENKKCEWDKFLDKLFLVGAFGDEQAVDVFSCGKKQLEQFLFYLQDGSISMARRKAAISNLIQRLPSCIAGVSTEAENVVNDILMDAGNIINNNKKKVIEQYANAFLDKMIDPNVRELQRGMDIHYVNKLLRHVANEYKIPVPAFDEHEKKCEITPLQFADFKKYLEVPATVTTFLDMLTQDYEEKMRAVSNHAEMQNFFNGLSAIGPDKQIRIDDLFVMYKKIDNKKIETGDVVEAIGVKDEVFAESKATEPLLSQKTILERLKKILYFRLHRGELINDELDKVYPIPESKIEIHMPGIDSLSFVTHPIEVEEGGASALSWSLLTDYIENADVELQKKIIETLSDAINPFFLISIIHLLKPEIIAASIREGWIKNEACICLLLLDEYSHQAAMDSLPKDFKEAKKPFDDEGFQLFILSLDQEKKEHQNPKQKEELIEQNKKNMVDYVLRKYDYLMTLDSYRYAKKIKWSKDLLIKAAREYKKTDFSHCHFYNMDLTDVPFDNAVFFNAHFERVTLPLNLFNGKNQQGVKLNQFTIEHMKTPDGAFYFDFSYMDLSNIDFTRINQYFNRQKFNFTGAKLVGCNFDLLCLYRCNFTNADLQDASLRSASLSILLEYNKTRTIYSAVLKNANLHGVKFLGSEHKGIEGLIVLQPGLTVDAGLVKEALKHMREELKSIKSSKDLPTTISGYDLDRRELNNFWDFRRVRFRGSYYSISFADVLLDEKQVVTLYKRGNRNFSGASFVDCNFSQLNLSGANFSGATFINCNFSQTKLENTNFVYAEFKEKNFFKDTIYANLSESEIKNYLTYSNGTVLDTCKRLLTHYVESVSKLKSLFFTPPRHNYVSEVNKILKQWSTYSNITELYDKFVVFKKDIDDELDEILKFCNKIHFGIGIQNKEFKEEKEYKKVLNKSTQPRSGVDK